MENLNIKPAKYGEQKIVEMFASPKQQAVYKEKQELTPKQRERLLDKASRYCEVSYLGDKKYSISKIHPYPLPAKWALMNKPLYKDLVPNLLRLTLKGIEDNQTTLVCPLLSWKRRVGMLPNKYFDLQYQLTNFDQLYGINCVAAMDFFKKLNKNLDYYMANAFKVLAEYGCFSAYDEYYITLSNGDIRQATEEEVNIHLQCIAYADKICGICKTAQRYCGIIGSQWNRTYKKELHKTHINFVTTYPAITDFNQSRIEFLLSMYENANKPESLLKDIESMVFKNIRKSIQNHPFTYDAEFYGCCQNTWKLLTEENNDKNN